MELVLTFVLLMLLLGGFYFLSRYGRINMSKQGNRIIKILDRTALAPDKLLAVVAVGERTMLVAFSGNAVEKLCDLSSEEVEKMQETIANSPSFGSVFNKALKNSQTEDGEHRD